MRLRITPVTPARRCSSGMTVPDTISCISYGTPGTAKIDLVADRADEAGGGAGLLGDERRALRARWAWRRLFSGMSRPRPPNIAADALLDDLGVAPRAATPMTSAMTSRVMSSWVGPEAAAHDHRVAAVEGQLERRP